MTTHEERIELMRIANELRQELRSVTKRVHLVINKLIGEADALALEAADERSAGEHVTRKTVTFTAPPDPEKFPEKTAVVVPERNANGRKRRTCSHCGQPGHWSTSCPKKDAELVAERKKGRKK